MGTTEREGMGAEKRKGQIHFLSDDRKQKINGKKKNLNFDSLGGKSTTD